MQMASPDPDMEREQGEDQKPVQTNQKGVFFQSFQTVKMER